MKVQKKFLVVFVGFAALLIGCGVALSGYNRSLRHDLRAELTHSAAYILHQATDVHHAPYYRYMTELRLLGPSSLFSEGERLRLDEREAAIAAECFDFDGMAVFDSHFELQSIFPLNNNEFSHFVPFAEREAQSLLADSNTHQFFSWYEGRLFELCLSAIHSDEGRIVAYVAVAREWTDSRLESMGLIDGGCVGFDLHPVATGSTRPLEPYASYRVLMDGANRPIAYICASYHSVLPDLDKVLRWEAMLPVVFAALFVAVMFICLVCWVIRPLRNLERALSVGEACLLDGVVRGGGEFGRIGTMVRMFFSQQKDLQAASDDVLRANRANSAFFASMSHEIRTPMSSLIGMLDMLLSGELSEDQSKIVQIMDRSCDALLRIINDILDFSRIEAGKLKLNSEEFNLYQLADDMELIAVQLRGDKPIDIELFVDPELPRWLIGDEGRIRQVMLNLISNAVKYTETGSIHVSILVKDSTSDLCNILLMVVDTGVGIQPSCLHSIFEIYEQGSASDGMSGSSGIGLAICRRLVDLMGGKIGIESSYGKGSTFTVDLKLPIAVVGELAPVVPDHIVDSFGYNVLVVDDQELNAEVLGRLLRLLGCTAEIATNGEAALALLNEHTYDMVFMDCHMPVMDGFECARRIRESEKWGPVHLPIYAVTADAMPQARERCMSVGMDDCLLKPVLLSGLRAFLTSCRES